MSFSPEIFGRYLLLEPISKSWNTESFYAKHFGTDGGPDRVVTIKKVVAAIGQEDLQRSFEQEIKITVALNHPNIVQTYDFGMVDNSYFMALEYLPGPNLKGLLTRLAEQDLMCSAELSCHIVSQVCHALSYAHGFRDRITGEPRAVVHRDISPEKIALSFDGAVKLVEFGLARMESREHFTRTGVVAGEPAYISPERLFGDDIDGRTDIYSLGVVLWEMLAGRSYRSAGRTLEEVRASFAAPFEAPSRFNGAVPKRLDSIVRKALAAKPADRYASIADMQRELHQFLYSYAPDFNPQDLAASVQELFRKELEASEQKLRSFLRAVRPVAPAAPAKEITFAAVNYAQVNTRIGIDGTGIVISDTAFTERELEKLFVKNVQNHEASVLAPSETGSMLIEAVSTRLLSSGASAAAAELPVEPAEASDESADFAPVLLTKADHRPAYAAGGLLALGLSLAFLFATATGSEWRAKLSRRESTHLGERVPVAAQAPAPPARGLASVPAATEEASVANGGEASAASNTAADGSDGTIEFTGDTLGFDLEVNGRFVPVVAGRFSWPVGVPFSLRARKPGAEDITYEGRLTSSRETLRIPLRFVPVRPKGFLSVITPVELKVKVYDGSSLLFEGRAPLSEAELPAGVYRLVLENPLLGVPEEQELRIEEGRRTDIEPR